MKNNTITLFLENWKEMATNFYIKERNSYIEAYNENEKAESDFCDKYNKGLFPISYKGEVQFKDNDSEMAKEYRTIYRNYKDKTEYTPKLITRLNPFDIDDFKEDLKEVLNKEVIKKEIQLIRKIEKVVGTIIDAKDLNLVAGEINGTIKGKKGVAKVNTILAGGYNIQCLHYRTLVKKVK